MCQLNTVTLWIFRYFKRRMKRKTPDIETFSISAFLSGLMLVEHLTRWDRRKMLWHARSTYASFCLPGVIFPCLYLLLLIMRQCWPNKRHSFNLLVSRLSLIAFTPLLVSSLFDLQWNSSLDCRKNCPLTGWNLKQNQFIQEDLLAAVITSCINICNALFLVFNKKKDASFNFYRAQQHVR